MRRSTVHVEFKAWNNATTLPCEAKACTMARKNASANKMKLYLRGLSSVVVRYAGRGFFIFSGGGEMDSDGKRCCCHLKLCRLLAAYSRTGMFLYAVLPARVFIK